MECNEKIERLTAKKPAEKSPPKKATKKALKSSNQTTSAVKKPKKIRTPLKTSELDIKAPPSEMPELKQADPPPIEERPEEDEFLL